MHFFNGGSAWRQHGGVTALCLFKPGVHGPHIGVGLVALQVLAVDQALDALFQVGLLDGELELLQQLGDEQLVAQRLARLHDAHDGRIDLPAALR